MSSKDAALYGFQRPKKLRGDKEISSNTTLSFASQLGSLINTSKGDPRESKPKRPKPKKEDIFRPQPHNPSKRAKRDAAEDAQPFGQTHTTHGDGVDRTLWERSKRKMEEKARLYAAMKRGDVEDMDERFAVDFDRKWAETHGDAAGEDLSDDDDGDDLDDQDRQIVEYTDEYGRTRTGTRAEAARVERSRRGRADLEGDRFTARPSAPTNIIYGDTIQHQAFDPDAPVAAQMEALAKKRDRSLTPPPASHFDASQEVRQRGTGFYQFSADAVERGRQMEALEAERAETERRRRETERRLRDEVVERDREFREDDEAARRKRKADTFLEELGEELHGRQEEAGGMDAMQRIEAMLAEEREEG